MQLVAFVTMKSLELWEICYSMTCFCFFATETCRCMFTVGHAVCIACLLLYFLALVSLIKAEGPWRCMATFTSASTIVKFRVWRSTSAHEQVVKNLESSKCANIDIVQFQVHNWCECINLYSLSWFVATLSVRCTNLVGKGCSNLHTHAGFQSDSQLRNYVNLWTIAATQIMSCTLKFQ